MIEVVVTTVVQSSSQIVTINKTTFNVLQAGCHSCRPTSSTEEKVHGMYLYL